MSILDNFPYHLKPRDVQKNTLLALEQQFDTAKVFVVNLPVASGKSALAITLAKYWKNAIILAPNKLLVNQYKNEYSFIHVLRAKADYYCTTFSCSLVKRPKSKKLGSLCKKGIGCEGCEQYLTDLRKARVMPYLLSNYHIYLAHKLYRDVVIVDEAHTLIDTVKQLNSKIYWQFKHQYPSEVKTREQLKYWINKLPEERFFYSYKQDGERSFAQQDNLEFLKQELNSYRPKYVIEFAEEEYRGEKQACIKLVPVDITGKIGMMFPEQTKKIILLSATISRKDIEQLGLSNKQVKYLQTSSPIASERRPVEVPAEACPMGAFVQDRYIPILKQFIINKIREHEGENGLIHATYSLANKLKQLDWPEDIKSKLLFHDKNDKAKKYQQFRNATEPTVLVASGMYEGIDLPYDAGRWQILAKIPWPSLGDPAIKLLSEEDPEFYAWEAIKTTLQACGRISRTLDDYGITYIFDKSFIRMYNQNPGLFPDWFKDSVRIYAE